MEKKEDILKLLGFSEKYLESFAKYEKNIYEINSESNIEELFSIKTVDSNNFIVTESCNNFNVNFTFIKKWYYPPLPFLPSEE